MVRCWCRIEEVGEKHLVEPMFYGYWGGFLDHFNVELRCLNGKYEFIHEGRCDRTCQGRLPASI